jgi:hypothetical protein
LRKRRCRRFLARRTRPALLFATMHDFNNAVERIVAGLENRNRLLNAR